MIPRFISCQQLVAAKGVRSDVRRVALGATGGRFGPPVFNPPTHPDQQGGPTCFNPGTACPRNLCPTFDRFSVAHATSLGLKFLVFSTQFEASWVNESI